MSLETAQYEHDHATPAEPPWHERLEKFEAGCDALAKSYAELRAILDDIEDRFYGASMDVANARIELRSFAESVLEDLA